MKKFGFISALLAAAMTASLFAGCNAKTGPETNAMTAAVKETPAAQEQTAAVKEAEPVSLKAVVLPDDAPTYKKAYEEFSKENPSIHVEITDFPVAEFTAKMMVQLAGGEPIDVYSTGNNSNYADYASKNLLAPLDEFIAKDKMDIAGFGPVYEGLKINGKLYSLPVRNSVTVLFYNKTLFDKAKVEYPKDDMTWDEFRELAKKMTSGEGNNKIWGAYIHTWPICWEQMAIQGGATTIDSDLTPFKKALQFRMDMEADGSIMKYTDQKATNAHYNSAFQKGNLAMHVIGDWHIAQLRQAEAESKINFDWDIASAPHPAGVSPNTTTGMATGVGINSKAKSLDAAWQFVKFMAGPEGASFFAGAGYVPGYVNDDVKKLMTYDGKTKPANIGILLNQKEYLEYPAIVGIGQVDKIFTEEAELTFAGERSVDDTIKKIQERIKELNLSK